MFPSVGGAPFSPNSTKVIRLILMGCTNRPFFHISVMEDFKTTKDPVIEQIGNYDPLPNKYNEKLVAINFKRLQYWIKEGALVSKPVHKLLGLSGYFPVHYSSFQDAWENRKRIKARLEELKTAVSSIDTELLKDSPALSSNSSENLHSSTVPSDKDS